MLKYFYIEKIFLSHDDSLERYPFIIIIIFYIILVEIIVIILTLHGYILIYHQRRIYFN